MAPPPTGSASRLGDGRSMRPTVGRRALRRLSQPPGRASTPASGRDREACEDPLHLREALGALGRRRDDAGDALHPVALRLHEERLVPAPAPRTVRGEPAERRFREQAREPASVGPAHERRERPAVHDPPPADLHDRLAYLRRPGAVDDTDALTSGVGRELRGQYLSDDLPGAWVRERVTDSLI